MREPLGYLYANGLGVERDDEQAAAWFRRADGPGSAGRPVQPGLSITSAGRCAAVLRRGRELYRRAADQGDADANEQPGRLYQTAGGWPETKAAAIALYEKAADLGKCGRCSTSVWSYLNGDGVRRATPQAEYWLRLSAKDGQRGWPKATWVGCTSTASGCGKSDVKAAEWYRRRPSRARAIPSTCSGRLYEAGRGVVRDKAAALDWYRKAAAGGHEQARTRSGGLGGGHSGGCGRC